MLFKSLNLDCYLLKKPPQLDEMACIKM